jgi:hypothetical protein
MRGSGWTPSIVPNGDDQNVYLVEDCFDRLGCCWREADSGQEPRRVIAFNIAERWVKDVSEDIAREIQRRADLAYDDISSTLETFIDRHVGPDRQLALRLA